MQSREAKTDAVSKVSVLHTSRIRDTRRRYSPSGAKDDSSDARMVARVLCADPQPLRPLEIEEAPRPPVAGTHPGRPNEPGRQQTGPAANWAGRAPASATGSASSSGATSPHCSPSPASATSWSTPGSWLCRENASHPRAGPPTPTPNPLQSLEEAPDPAAHGQHPEAAPARPPRSVSAPASPKPRSGRSPPCSPKPETPTSFRPRRSATSVNCSRPSPRLMPPRNAPRNSPTTSPSASPSPGMASRWPARCSPRPSTSSAGGTTARSAPAAEWPRGVAPGSGRPRSPPARVHG